MGRFNLNIKQKMVALALLMGVGLALLITANYLSIASLGELDEIRYHAGELQADMLMLRRHEKDFIARKELNYVEKFEQSFAQMNDTLAKLGHHVESRDLEVDEVGPLKKILTQYRDSFTSLVEQQKVIGLHEKDGLYGSLRDKVHNIEGLITAYEKEHGSNVQTHSLMRTMLMLRRHEKDFMLRRNPKYVATFSKRIETMQAKLREFKLGDDFEDKAISALAQYNQDFLALVKGEERFGLTSKQGILGEMRETIHQSETLLDSLSASMEKIVSEHISQRELLNLVTGIILAALMIGLLIVVSINITSRVGKLSAVMSNARRDKDLSVRATVSGSDEIASMATVYNEMMEDFDGLMRDVRSSSTDLAAAAEQLERATGQTVEGVNRQLVESEQVATAMNEMSATVNEVARNASQAAEASAHADEASSRGSQRVEENRKSFTQLAGNIDNSGHIIANLSEESNNIGAMLNVIRGIAEQTNLLALNAAIEAARAGEQGRGFAVVADEVRTLAQRSAQSTQDIENVVTRLQGLADDAVNAMQQGKAQAEESVVNTANVEKALSEINSSIERVNNMNIQIATAAEQQSHVSEEINRSVLSITDVARDTSQLTETIAAAGVQLQSLSALLGERVSKFRLS